MFRFVLPIKIFIILNIFNQPIATRKFKSGLLEIQVFEWKVDFHDTSGLDSGPQNVLFGGLILFGTKPIEIIQETVIKNKTLST